MRPRSRSLRSGAFLFLAGAAVAAAASAVFAGALGGQEPVPPDTAAVDTLGADTLPPPPQLPRLEPAGPTGWAAGVWHWDRRALLMLPDLSLLDLLERVPGITPVRVAIAGQPEGAAVLGTAAAGIRYFLDGFELDPLTTPSFDPSRLSLLALSSVRVERGVTGAVVRLETLRPTDPRPQSVVEAATGDIGVNLFRGIFLAPSVLGGPLALGFERLASEAGGGSARTVGWLQWTFVRDSIGIQLQYRQSEVDRTGLETAFLGGRSDWVLRARARLLGAAVEGYAGASTVEDDFGELLLHEGTAQAGLRLYHSGDGPIPTDLRAALRFRDHPRLPRAEATAELWAEAFPWLALGLDLRHGWWSEGAATRSLTTRLRVGPPWLHAFSERTDGDAPAARLFAPEDSVVFEPMRTGSRLGIAFDRWGFHAAGAFLDLETDTVAGFGVGFDPTAPRFEGGEATGREAIVRIPTGWAPLALEGWYLDVDAPEGWLYLPDRQWKAGLVYRHVPLPSGNLEIHGRAEHLYRGPMWTPCGPPLGCTDSQDGVQDGRVRIGAFASTNFELTIRVVTVRAFIRWENIFHRRFQRDLPIGYPGENPFAPGRLNLPGQHFVYGVKWEFLN